jgi:hypothetical protein
MFDLVSVNSWFLWLRGNNNEHMSLVDFKIIVVDCL